MNTSLVYKIYLLLQVDENNDGQEDDDSVKNINIFEA